MKPDPAKWRDNRIEALPVPVIAGVHGFALVGCPKVCAVAARVAAEQIV